MPADGTACNDLLCSQPIFGCVPVCRNSWGYSQERVVLAQTSVGAKRALMVHILPVTDIGQSLMREPTWTLVTTPPHAQVTASCDPPVSQIPIFGMVPLPLQLWPEQADVWAC